LRKLDEDEVASLLQQTFAIIIQHWSTVTPESQQRAYDIVAHLFKTYRQLIREKFQLIPSLAAIPLMSKFESDVSRLKEKMEVNEHFKTFALRCKDENSAVVLQGFRELLPFLERNQRFIHEAAISQQQHGVVADLARSTLDSLTRFAVDNMEIAILCSKCLGLIGCLDPTRIETVRAKRDMLILSNFEPAGEAVDFVAFLLENVLVGEFTSAANARSQGFLAYVMQELLQFGGFSQVAMYRPRASQPSTVYQRWMEIGESVRNTLVPFLSSKYLLVRNAPMPPEPKNRPIFSPDIRGKGDNAKMIFQVLLRVVRSPDTTISNFLAPFATLNVILGGTSEEAVDIGHEILAVLESDMSKATRAEADRIKQCSEVSSTTSNSKSA
jgi:serine/threonine-protein kinase ATR